LSWGRKQGIFRPIWKEATSCLPRAHMGGKGRYLEKGISSHGENCVGQSKKGKRTYSKDDKGNGKEKRRRKCF